MKNICILILFTILNIAVESKEIRAIMVEPFPPVKTHQDSVMHIPFLSTTGSEFFSPICFKFYDTLLGYDQPHNPADTITNVHWTFYLPRQPFQFDTTVPKGTVYYWFVDFGRQAQWQFSADGNGRYVQNTPVNGYSMAINKPYSIFSLKELESSCNHKKWQVMDSSTNIPLEEVVMETKWYLVVRDSLQNIVLSDSGREVPMYTAEEGRLIIHQRDNPVFELNNPGIYTVSFIVTMVNFVPAYDYTDTSTILVRVECPTSITNSTVKNENIHLQALPNNQLEVQNNSLDYNSNTLQIYSPEGKILKEQPFSNKTSVNLSQLPKGLYIITITDKNQLIYSDKILLQ